MIILWEEEDEAEEGGMKGEGVIGGKGSKKRCTVSSSLCPTSFIRIEFHVSLVVIGRGR